MEKCLPKLSKAAPAAMYGFFILLCLPFVWQQILLSSQPVSAIEPKFVPKSGIEKQNLLTFQYYEIALLIIKLFSLFILL
jgi:hypothetical protein